jgi:beta-glucosidase
MRLNVMRIAAAAGLALGAAACSPDKEYVVTQEIPACSATYPTGSCPTGQTCFGGTCAATSGLCSASNKSGTCPGGWSCYEGGCIPAAAVPQACSETVPNGTCEEGSVCVQGTCLSSASVCSATNQSGVCPTNWACYKGGCIVADPTPPDPCAAPAFTAQPVLRFAADFGTTTPTAGTIGPDGKPLGTGAAPYTYDHDANPATPAVEVPYTQKSAITVDGRQFRDLNHNGTLERYEDWRYRPICRARDLVTRMTVRQKTALMQETSNVGAGTTTGVLEQTAVNVLADEMRAALVRYSANLGPQEYATYTNSMQAMCEGSALGIPFIITGDPGNFVTQSTSGAGAQSLAINPALSQWPNPAGLGAINDAAISFAYGDAVRKDLMGMGFRWQLGPMVDIATEPRFGRVITMLGENGPAVTKHAREIVLGFQAGRDGLAGGIAATVKHFPGTGPEEEGKDSHGYRGKYNVYPAGMFDYHLEPFRAVIDAGAASVMPAYSIEKGILDWNPEQVGTAFSHGMITRLLKQELGFDGMITSDWGLIEGFCAIGICSPHGVEGLTYSERAALFIKAGNHQLGFDRYQHILNAYNEGLLDDADIDGAAEKVLEMSFKLGIFENPYTDSAHAALARSAETMQAGFDAQKKSIVLLKNNSAARLPISQTRYANLTTLPNGQPGTPNAPDVGEFGSDTNRNGTIEVFYDGVLDALNGTDRYSAAPISLMDDYDYRAAGSGTPGTAGFALPIAAAASAATADIAVLRITARNGAQNGYDRGVPLSFDGLYPGFDNDGSRAGATADARKVIDLFRIRDGYTMADGTFVGPTNSSLRIVLVLHMLRPAIVRPFVWGLRTLDERPGCLYTGGGAAGLELCYPVVSDEANVNRSDVNTTTPTAHAGVDVFLVDFGAYDRALLDVLFNQHVPTTPTGYVYGMARLPQEIPNSDEAVNAQLEDAPADSLQPTYVIGSGMNLPAQ